MMDRISIEESDEGDCVCMDAPPEEPKDAQSDAAACHDFLTRREAGRKNDELRRLRIQERREARRRETQVWRGEVAALPREAADAAAPWRAPRLVSLRGAHHSHDLRRTGPTNRPIVFCERCAAYITSGKSQRLADECTNVVMKPDMLKLLQWGVSPSMKGARLPPEAREHRPAKQRRYQK